MSDRGLGQNAMAEIENMGAARKAAQHPIDLLVEAPSACNQRQRIEIALERQPVGQSGDGRFGLCGGVETDRVDFGESAEFGELRAGAARKGDQRRAAASWPEPWPQ